MQLKTRNIFLPILGICLLIFFIGLIFWKKLCRYRRPVTPYNNTQLAFITQRHQQQPYQTARPLPPIGQQRPYQTAWPLPPIEQQRPYQTAWPRPPIEQQRPYQTAWPRPPIEQPPPSYYTAMMPPFMSYVKQ